MSAGREWDRRKPVKAVIAEDEGTLLDELRETLAALWPEFSICAVATNGIQALREMEQHAPDVLFLDIQMPGMSGLRLRSGRADAATSFSSRPTTSTRWRHSNREPSTT